MVWYEEEVSRLEQKIKNGIIKKDQNLFYGSSSFRRWETLIDDLDMFDVSNISFGGSTLESCVYFFERLVIASQPKSIILYAGDNDVGDGKPIDKICYFLNNFLIKLDTYFPDIPFAFLSIKPSPAREHLDWQIREFNRYAKERLSCRENSYFVDVYSQMLNKKGRPDISLFCSDGLHINEQGYEIWKKELLKNSNKFLIQ